MLYRSNLSGVAAPVGKYYHITPVPADVDLVFVSGQIGNHLDGGPMAGDAAGQARRALLEEVVAADGRATAKSLAHKIGLSQSTCYQMLKTLELTGYIVHTPAGFYEVGPSVPATFRRLRTVLVPEPRVSRALHALRDETGDTAYACAPRGSGIVLQEVAEGYAVERQEFEEGVGCVSAPYFDLAGAVAGPLTVAMPLARLDADEARIARTVIAHAATATHPAIKSELPAVRPR